MFRTPFSVSGTAAAVRRHAWTAAGWALLNLAALALGWLADLLSAQAVRDMRRTFRVAHDAGWIWLAGLVMALVWVGLGFARQQAAARAPRWGFGLMSLVAGLLVVLCQPALFFYAQTLLARAHLYRFFSPFMRLILGRGFDNFFILTAQVLLALNLLGLWETRKVGEG